MADKVRKIDTRVNNFVNLRNDVIKARMQSMRHLKEELYDHLMHNNSLSTKQEENKMKRQFTEIEEL